jgi:CRISPR-associated protein Csd2
MTVTNKVSVKNRTLYFVMDVENGTFNNDPDADNEPRQNHNTGIGLISDSCTKRKIRTAVAHLAALGLLGDQNTNLDEVAPVATSQWNMLVRKGAVLNDQIKDAYVAGGIKVEEPTKVKVKAKKTEESSDDDDDIEITVNKEDRKRRVSVEDAKVGNRKMCEIYFDFRWFGGVVTGVGSGRMTGPIQICIGQSVEPIDIQTMAVTRMATATKEESEKQKGQNQGMGRKHFIPYALYTQKGTVSPFRALETGFSEEDFEVFLKALKCMYEIDRSTSRGTATLRQVYIFEHEDPLGNARAADLYDLVKIERVQESVVPTKFSDYKITVGKLPPGVTLRLLYPEPDPAALAAE